ncbi:TPA: hypothetical protein SAN82_000553 [Pseudomonas putida]|nr:hypothetical protein [Pseudomonas putida]
MTGRLVVPDLLTAAPASSPDAAKEVCDVADSNPASKSEVILKFIKVPLLKNQRLPDFDVKGRVLAGQVTIGLRQGRSQATKPWLAALPFGSVL